MLEIAIPGYWSAHSLQIGLDGAISAQLLKKQWWTEAVRYSLIYRCCRSSWLPWTIQESGDRFLEPSSLHVPIDGPCKIWSRINSISFSYWRLFPFSPFADILMGCSFLSINLYEPLYAMSGVQISSGFASLSKCSDFSVAHSLLESNEVWLSPPTFSPG